MTPTPFSFIHSDPLPMADDIWFIDGSSTNIDNHKTAGCAVVNRSQTIEASTLLPGTSSQKAEFIALTWALTLIKDKNIYTDPNYAFSILRSHAETWQERGLISVQGTPIINGPLILKLPEAAQLPAQVAVTQLQRTPIFH